MTNEYVFMCYSRKDEDFVLSLADALKLRGVPVWVDQWDISAADDWDMEVEQALSGCSHLVVVLSPDSMKSDEVGSEWRVAQADDKLVIPVQYKECHIHRKLRFIQRVDFTSGDPTDATGLSQLLSVLGMEEHSSSDPRVIWDPRGGLLIPFRAYTVGISRARAVARIGPSAEEHFGSGFLVDGADLDPRLEGQQLLVTCNNVVSDSDLRALRPNRAVVTFRASGKIIREFGVRYVVWSCPVGDLDISILRLEGDTSGLPSVPWAEGPLDDKEQHVFIWGYESGGALSFSFGDNLLVDQNDRFLQYRAPTAGGMGGCPVFNTNWELIAVHTMGGFLPRLTSERVHDRLVKQGSSVFAIREAIQKDELSPE
jgi:hypothetical protein